MSELRSVKISAGGGGFWLSGTTRLRSGTGTPTSGARTVANKIVPLLCVRVR